MKYQSPTIRVVGAASETIQLKMRWGTDPNSQFSYTVFLPTFEPEP